ncbi:MAG TPA: YraN family protein [Acidimicrobiia bacterium]|nr:YraN family protein [Acidimicrobiia bacterium]
MASAARPDPRRVLGNAGEDLVARWYADAGYRVLDRNWRCREGELDVVVARDSVLVFCEVKTRRSTTFGSPAEAVTITKQRRLRTLAMRWLDAHPEARARTVRFDVASVLAERGRPLVLDVIESAF